MDGILGWQGSPPGQRELLDRMAHASGLSENDRQRALLGNQFGLATASRFGKAATHQDEKITVAVHGRPAFRDGELAALTRSQGAATAVAAGWLKHGRALPNLMSGPFAMAVLQPDEDCAFLAIDRIGAERLCFWHNGSLLVFGTHAKGVATAQPGGARIAMQAIYDYLYFHCIPSPRTVFDGVEKLLPGQFVHWKNGQAHRDFYWQADYNSETKQGFPAYRHQFRELLNQSVHVAAGLDTPAAFLSGGTDSSTVVGVLTSLRNAPADTFSIGFEADGFDEMEYVRCAAERFKSNSREYYLKPQDIVDAVPVIAAAYDEPFGNSSAVPTYFCAKHAREAGFKTMLAGDGGDEIFGGNARYAKQRAFEAYTHIPAFLRKGLIEPASRLPGLGQQFPLRKLRSYVDQANIPLPLRLETYNFLHRTPLAEIFDPSFINAVDPASTDRALSEVYGRTRADHYINRLMHVDLKFTLADNDLRKVGTMTEVAGIEVRYPLLDDRLVEFANHLPVDYKVRGHKLRWFFKEALRDLLPEKIIHKSKHGFGLPFGIWCNQHRPLGELANDSLSDFGKRGWVRPQYLDHLLRMQREEHASYYGTMIWVMMILEQWLQANDL